MCIVTSYSDKPPSYQRKVLAGGNRDFETPIVIDTLTT